MLISKRIVYLVKKVDGEYVAGFDDCAALPVGVYETHELAGSHPAVKDGGIVVPASLTLEEWTRSDTKGSHT